jgi:glycosyltransferase involved in cell wall biosynthesis
MRVALLSPYSAGPVRGNITTVNRIARFLNPAGADSIVLAADAFSISEMRARLDKFSPELVHGFHACYCGGIAAAVAHHFRTPLVITITGSDISDPPLRNHPATLCAMTQASAITCFSQSEADEVIAHFPQTAPRIAIIPQGVEPLPTSGNRDFGIPDDAFIVLLPAALRRVKNVEFAIDAMKPIWEADKRFRLVIAGGEIDHKYAAEICSKLDMAPWVTWLREVPHNQMGELYHRADVVLNCSHFEGMPNSLMEAMALGRPVVAANIPGNRSLIHHERTGWLFKDEAEFRELVIKLAGDIFAGTRVGRRARKEMRERFSPRQEAKRYLSLYHKLASTGSAA